MRHRPTHYVVLLCLILAGSLFSTAETLAQTFQHPGLLNTQAELDFVKQKVNANAQPWKAGYDEMLSWTVRNNPTPRTIVYSKNSTMTDLRKDGHAAYYYALRWVVTGDQQYANKSMQFMDAWSGTLQAVENGGGHPKSHHLESSFVVPMWTNAAEIIRHYNNGAAGWPQAKVNDFENMLTTIFFPLYDGFSASCDPNKTQPACIYDNSPEFDEVTNRAGNWETSFALAMISIGVFTDDRAKFDVGRDLWEWVMPRNIWPSGEIGEVCRGSSPPDCTHPEMSLLGLIEGAEIAWHQGIDLYSTKVGGQSTPRLAVGMEYVAKLMLGIAQPTVSCGTVQCDGRSVIPGWEIAYNHFNNRTNVAVPKTGDLVQENRPEGQRYNFIGWTTLTHANLPADSSGGGGNGGSGPQYEVEDLSYTPTGATANTFTDSNASGGSAVKLDADGVGDMIEFDVYVNAGTYQVAYGYKQYSSDRGQVQLWTGGQDIGGLVDFCASTTNWVETPVLGTITYSTSGSKKVRFTTSAASCGYAFVLDYILLTPDTTSSSNQSPVANFTATPTSGAAPLAMSFDGSSSDDADGTISSYAWDFGDGSSGSGASVNHTYANAGTYVATLTVTDDDGATAQDSTAITVSPTPACTSPVNLALNQPVSVSGEESSNPGSNAVDGIDDTDANRWSVQNYPQSLEVDLGSVSLISSTELVPYNSRGFRYRIEGKTTATGSYTTLVDQTAYSGGNYSSDVQSFSEAEARYVKVTITGCSGSNCSAQNWVSLREFKVNGCAGSVDEEYIYLEAENTTLSSPLVVGNDANASGNGYVWYPSGNRNDTPVAHASYSFTVNNGGDYYLWGRAITGSTGADSYWVRVDGGSWINWNYIAEASASTWTWDEVHAWDGTSGVQAPLVFSLSPGMHTLEISEREQQVKLDRLLITDDLAFVPSGLGGSANARTAVSSTGGRMTDPNMIGEGIQADILVYPNPGAKRFKLAYDATVWEGGEVRVTDLLGREVVRQLLSSRAAEVDLSAQQAGIYLITVSKGDQQWIGRIVNE